MTWEQIVTQALTRSRLLGRGLTINNDLRLEAYSCLGIMLDKFDGMGLEIPAISYAIQFNTVGGQARYLLGDEFSAGQSDDTVAIGSGLKTWPNFEIGESLLAVGMGIKAVSGSAWMSGTIAEISGTALTIHVTDGVGSGEYSEWAFTATLPRPQRIISGTFEINPGVAQGMVPLDLRAYWKIPIKDTTSPPWNYAYNPIFPISEVYFYPTPDSQYPVTLYAKLTWSEIFGNISKVSNQEAALAPGVSSALIDNLALALAEQNGKQTDVMYRNASAGRNIIQASLPRQDSDDMFGEPSGMFGSTIAISGANP